MIPNKASGVQSPEGMRNKSGTLLPLLDAAIAAWLWYALQCFSVHAACPVDRVLGPALASPAIAFLLRAHRMTPGRGLKMLAKAVLIAAALAALGSVPPVRSWLHVTEGQVLWLAASTGILIWLSRAVFFGTWDSHGGKPTEVLRWLAVGITATAAMSPFYYSGGLGSGDAHWYTLMLSDFVTQLRAGVFPVWVGQSTYAFNGAVSPLRFAPGFQYFGGLLDVLTGRSLEFTALRNAELVVAAMAGAYSAYACIRPILKGAPWIACSLAILWMLGPGILAPLMVGDQYMTFMTLPFIPLTLHGCWRVLRFGDRWGRLFIAVGLAGTWLCHPPVALWLTISSACMYIPIFFCGRPWSREVKLGLFISAIFMILATITFVSVLTLDNQVKDEASGLNALDVIHTTFPANFLPIRSDKPGLPSYQVGFALLGTLLLSLRLMAGSRPKGAWAFALASVIIIPFGVPVPWITDALWTHIPGWFVTIQNVWPMQRLFLVWSSFIVFLAAVVMAGTSLASNPKVHGFFLACLMCGIAWSSHEAMSMAKGIYPFRTSVEDIKVGSNEDNLLLTRYAYSSYTYPPSYFSHAYMDPWLENRLLDPHTLEVLESNSDASAQPPEVRPGASSTKLVQSGAWTGHSIGKSEYYMLEPRLVFEAGKHYALLVDFSKPGTTGTLQIKSHSLFREYSLPDSGGGVGRRGQSLAFGSDPWNSHVMSISGYADGPDQPTSLYIASAYSGETVPFAHFSLYSYSRSELPISVESWMPYRARVDYPKTSYLETPRMWLKGWKARVNGRWRDTVKSPENLVMVAVGAGVSQVTLDYFPPVSLEIAFWMGAAGWAALACAGMAQLVLWAGGSKLAFGWARTPQWISDGIDLGIMPLNLARRHKAIAAAIVMLAAVGVALQYKKVDEEANMRSVGPIRVEFRRPRGLLGYNEPILTTGEAGKGTIVFANYIDDKHARIEADIWGRLYTSEPVPMAYGEVQSLVVSDSALFPLKNPRVKELSSAEIEHLRGEMRIELNGSVVMKTAAYAYETKPSEVLSGEAPFGSTTDRRFSGDILKVERLPIPRELGVPEGRHAHLRIKFPLGRTGAREPLASIIAGESKRVAYVRYGEAGKLQLTIWGSDGVPPMSADIAYDPKIAHDIDLDPGEATEGLESFEVACFFDGHHVIGHSQVSSPQPPVVTSGLNTFDAPGVEARFTGPELNMSLASDSGRGDQPESNGPIHMVVRFPANLSGRSEPLLTTGHTGAGDFVFVSYVDAGHVRIGFDHWGYGGSSSAVLPLDYSAPHELWISIASLFPSADDNKAWRDLDPAVRKRLMANILVVLDGKTVIAAPASTYPATAAEITVAKNPIGGSTCDPTFNGSTVFVERAGPVSPPTSDR